MRDWIFRVDPAEAGEVESRYWRASKVDGGAEDEIRGAAPLAIPFETRAMYLL
jgi:hypothetical protein